MGLETSIKGRYANIFSDGTLREKVREGDDGAVKREYETSDGKKGVKWERVYDSIRGRITNVYFREGDFGWQLCLKFEDEQDNIVTITTNVDSNFAEDIMKKLPTIDLNHSMWMSPFAFEDDKGKLRKGVTIMQGEKKATNYFMDAETKELKNGYPAPEGDTKTYDKDDWKMYFMKARKFLMQHTRDTICVRFEDANKGRVESVEYPKDDINPDDIPF